MNPTVVRHLVLPWMLRKTWPEVRRWRSELERSQWLSSEALAERQLAGVRALARRALEQSPFHRRRFREHGIDPDQLTSLEALEKVPFLEKADLRRERESILCEDADRNRITASATGGTTGEPTRYWWDDLYWCASSAVTQRAYGFLGFEPGDRHAMIWGTAFHQSRRALLKERLQNRLKNLLVVPGFDLGPATMATWAERLARYRPKLVEGYTSLLTLVASYLLEHGITTVRPRCVVSSAERLHGFQRDLIARAFGAPVYDRYGTREVGCIAAECPQGSGLHVSSEHVLVEIWRDGRRAAPGESGEIVVTCLNNRVFPFIRYRIGDLGALRADPCPCGRGLPLLDLTEGRVHDLLTTAGGSYLPGEFFPHLFKDYPGVQEFQVHQAADRSVTIRIVRTPAWNAAQEQSYAAEVGRALGPAIPVAYVYVDRIERTRAGKLRFTSSDVPVELVSRHLQPAPAAAHEGARTPE